MLTSGHLRVSVRHLISDRPTADLPTAPGVTILRRVRLTTPDFRLRDPAGGKFVARAASVPFAASGPRVPTKRPRGIPPAVQAACVKMIWEGCDRVEAARTSNLKPDTLRRWLHRPEVVSFLLKEGNAHCQAICAGNVHTLAQIRDAADGNQMARVASVKTLELIRGEALLRRPSEAVASPGVVLNIVTYQAPQSLQPTDMRLIDAGD